MDNSDHMHHHQATVGNNYMSQAMNPYTTPDSKPEDDPFDFSPVSIFQMGNTNTATATSDLLLLPPNAGFLNQSVAAAAMGPPPSKKKKPASPKDILVKSALDYVAINEKHHFKSLEKANGNDNISILAPVTRLMDLMALGNDRTYRSAVNKVECCLGKWVVHSYKYTAEVYVPAEHESCVLRNWNANNRTQKLDKVWLDDIEEHAKAEKVKYKVILDARKEALDGILGTERARLVNNQKSAHLSKFQNNIVETSKSDLIKFFVENFVHQ